MHTLSYQSAFIEKARDVRRTFNQSNVGGIDRVLRMGLASVLIVDILHGTGPLGLEPYFAIAAIPLIITALLAWDPIYALFKVRTATLRNTVSHGARTDQQITTYAGINVGAIDRIFRVLLASVLIATPFLWTESIAMGAVVGTCAGIAVMMTAIMGWDPIYQMADIRTATLKPETVPQQSYSTPVVTFELFDKVEGDDVDILLKAA